MDTLTKVAGIDFYFTPFSTMIHQPSIKEIALLGEQNFFDALSILEGSSSDFFIKQILKTTPSEEIGAIQAELNYTITSDLDVFYRYCLGKREQQIMKSFFYLIFESLRNINFVQIGNTKMLIQFSFHDCFSKEADQIQTITLDNKGFDELKDTISDMFSYETIENKEAKLNPAGEMAKKIAEKMAAAAERRAKIYGHNNKSKDTESIISTMVSILATSDGILLTEILKLTFPQVLIQLNRTQLLQQYHTQITLGAFGGLDANDLANWQESV